ncbi:MAG: serine/threonine-protein kinase HipA [Bacteroidia bacterium]
MKDVDIYLFEDLVGKLSVDRYGTLSFQYDSKYLTSEKSAPISCSLPLKEELYYGQEAHTFFQGLLPEETQLQNISKAIGTDPENAFRLLNELGKETVGALTIGQSSDTHKPSYELLITNQITNLLEQKEAVSSNLYLQNQVRLSLAGAQSKFSVLYQNENYYLTQYGAISNRIVKPSSDTYSNLVENEYLSMTLATACGINTAHCSLEQFGTKLAYVVDRFDRKTEDGNLKKIHQEDFCQAAGVLSSNKYERDGGPSFITCLEIINNNCSIPALAIGQFIDLFIFNFLISNKDAHGKNFSLLHDLKHTTLTPAYDLVATGLYPNLSQDMAMGVNGLYIDSVIALEDWDNMCSQGGISFKRFQVRYKRIHDLLNAALNQLQHDLIDQKYLNTYKSYIQNRLDTYIELGNESK